ncbi:hypothetical protein [Frigoriglobus tundricola]|uniref:Uncharacterized protein n=1 Tax=Frigoriglobus tundricola TaxID=2774151 RepID=A0A6M5YGR6_9BACT|nr:hypothetical protein [Frigoriglobus tundricola]QJW93239.1 hypothetical protein FTUN_0744 [Frigoriglobus tundricola]
MKTIRVAAVIVACLWWAPAAHGQARARAAREAAEMLFEQFGAKAGRSVPELTARIEGIAARYGDDAIIAMRKGGPSALGLVEAAGADGARAVRVLAVHGEQGASRVLSRPTAMKQFLQYGDDAAWVLVRHPGVAEPLVERGGAQAVKALGAVDHDGSREHHPTVTESAGAKVANVIETTTRNRLQSEEQLRELPTWVLGFQPSEELFKLRIVHPLHGRLVSLRGFEVSERVHFDDFQFAVKPLAPEGGKVAETGSHAMRAVLLTFDVLRSLVFGSGVIV